MIRKFAVTGLLSILIGLYVGSIISYSQGGWTSTHINSGGKDLNTVYFIDSKHGWVGGDGGFLAYTDDGGATWIERHLGSDHPINDVYFVSKDHGVALTGGSIFETSDAGHTWTEAHKFSPGEFAR